jgi:hypothetical protein
MTSRSVASKQFRKQEAFSQGPPYQHPSHPQRMRPNPTSIPSSHPSPQPDVLDPTKKLSISDAIGLITIRLSKVESYLLKNKDNIDGSSTSTTGEHADLDTIVRNLVNRLNSLEKEQSSLKTIVESEQNTTQTSENTLPLENLVSCDQFDSLLNRVDFLEKQPTPVIDDTLLSRVEKNTQDIQELKQMVLKLSMQRIDFLENKQQSDFN